VSRFRLRRRRTSRFQMSRFQMSRFKQCRQRRVAAAIAAVVLVGTLVSSCAIPTQSRPSVIGHVPFHLLAPRSPSTTTTQPLASSLVAVKIYLIGSSQQLVAVQRLIPSPAPLTSVLSSLIVGPTDSESVGGTTTAIPSSVRVISVTTQSNVVTVNFNAAFAQITGASTEVAVSQVVYTIATQNGANTGVIFEINGQRTSVPITNGATVFGPVYYYQFTPTPTTTTTAAPAAAA
jgi:hypothetical protein